MVGTSTSTNRSYEIHLPHLIKRPLQLSALKIFKCQSKIGFCSHKKFGPWSSFFFEMEKIRNKMCFNSKDNPWSNTFYCQQILQMVQK